MHLTTLQLLLTLRSTETSFQRAQLVRAAIIWILTKLVAARGQATRTAKEAVIASHSRNLQHKQASQVSIIRTCKGLLIRERRVIKQPSDLSLRAIWKTNNSSSKPIPVILPMQLELFQTKIWPDSPLQLTTFMIKTRTSLTAAKATGWDQETINNSPMDSFHRVVASDRQRLANHAHARKLWIKQTLMG